MQVKGKRHPVEVYEVATLDVMESGTWARSVASSEAGTPTVVAPDDPPSKSKRKRRKERQAKIPPEAHEPPAAGALQPIIGREDIIQQVSQSKGALQALSHSILQAYVLQHAAAFSPTVRFAISLLDQLALQSQHADVHVHTHKSISTALPFIPA